MIVKEWSLILIKILNKKIKNSQLKKNKRFNIAMPNP